MDIKKKMPQPKEPIIFCWSGGKDSALALYRILRAGEYEVKYLFTTVNENFKRISMHGIREELLEAQTASIGIPLVKVYVKEGSNAEYERNMEKQLLEFKKEGITKIGFGDIFLEDLRQYRDNNLAKIGMTGIYPLWKEDTRKLLDEFLQLGFKTIICCVNDSYLPESFAGKIIDETFIDQLPANVDPCGENGEFHTFCFEGPVFSSIIKVEATDKVFKPIAEFGSDGKGGFWFSEIREKIAET